jgi:hypothetical protein
VYVDGKFVGALDHGSSVAKVYSGAPAAVGRKSVEADMDHFDGAIDELRIYDRTLTDAEVLALFVAPGATNAVPAVSEKEVADLVRQLGADDAGARRKAKSRLKELGRQVLPILVRYREHADPEVRLSIQELLAP